MTANQIPLSRSFYSALKLYFTSPLLIGITLFAVTVLIFPLELSAAIGGLILLGLMTLHHRLPPRILYEMSVSDLIIREHFSLLCPKWSHQKWWHQITPQLYLGGIPLSSRGHFQCLVDQGVNAVLAILEEYESKLETFFSQPVLQSDWEKGRIAYQQLCCPDMKALSQKDLNESVEQVHTWIQQGKIVYVHCKAGRGRSAMVIIGYFLRYEHLSLQDAIKKLREVRSVIRFQPCQLEALKEFEISIRKAKARFQK